jgi:hypothetical protein
VSGLTKTKTSSKNKRSRMTRGAHVMRATLAAQTAQASTPAAPGTLSPDNKAGANSDNNNSEYHILLMGFLK